MTTVTPINVAKTTAQIETETPKKEKTTITFQEWWSGEKSLTSTAARRVGWENLADWLEDKDKVCTDGKDDGNIGFTEGAKSFTKGLLGGLPKAIIQHPLFSGITIAGGAAFMALSGGAIAPLLWGLGATIIVGNAGINLIQATTAKTDGEKKAALEGLGTSTTAAVIAGATYKPAMNAAKTAGVNTEGNIVQTMKSSAEISARNAKANYMTWKTGVIQPNSNIGRVQEQALTEAKELVDNGEHWYIRHEVSEKAPSIIKRAGVKVEEPNVVDYHYSSYRDEFSGHIYETTATRNGKSISVKALDCGDKGHYWDGIQTRILEALVKGDL